MPIYKKVNKNFFKKWTGEMAYVLGFFAADGYITLNKRGAYFWSIQITDKIILENIKKAVQADHKISVRSPRGNNSILYRLQIGSKEMCRDLQKLGFVQGKTKSLAVPNVPKKYFSDFVRGYFDGDGNVWMGFVHKERITKLLAIRTVFTSCSMQFLEVMRQRLDAFGVKTGVLKKENGNYYRLIYSIHGSLKLSDFMYNHNAYISKFFLKRKKKIFERYIKMRP
ncbi:MAG: LAGLIDADG family homing endonuclease [bacterium]|nr:LAGLIDADG family homing endonuclease [bacterium]